LWAVIAQSNQIVTAHRAEREENKLATRNFTGWTKTSSFLTGMSVRGTTAIRGRLMARSVFAISTYRFQRDLA
jgi:hypothetical protein